MLVSAKSAPERCRDFTLAAFILRRLSVITFRSRSDAGDSIFAAYVN